MTSCCRIVRTVDGIAAIAAVSVAASALATVPEYPAFELQARSNIVDGFNLPAGSSFNSGTPALNDGGAVAFRLIVVGSSGNAGIWTGAGGVGSVVYEAPSESLTGDPSINTAGDVLFEQFFGSDGVFLYDASADTTALRIPLGGIYGIASFSDLGLADSGAVGFRGGGIGGNNYVEDIAGVQTRFVSEGTSPYGFLFTSSYNNAGQLAGKARVGGITGSLPDELRVFESDGSSSLRAVDDDGDAGSPFSGFDNSIALDDNGNVAFVAFLVGGGRGVFMSDGKATTEIATTNDPEITVIEFFRPSMNNQGLVAFRGQDAAGLDAVFVGDGDTLRRVIGEHDLLPTDLGTARIDQNDDSITFGGAVAINENGDIAFNATLTPPDDNQIEWGTGCFIAYAQIGLAGDINGDETVGFDDLLLLLAAWDSNSPDEDLSGDGTVGFDDLLILLANWS